MTVGRPDGYCKVHFSPLPFARTAFRLLPMFINVLTGFRDYSLKRIMRIDGSHLMDSIVRTTSNRSSV